MESLVSLVLLKTPARENQCHKCTGLLHSGLCEPKQNPQRFVTAPVCKESRTKVTWRYFSALICFLPCELLDSEANQTSTENTSRWGRPKQPVLAKYGRQHTAATLLVLWKIRRQGFVVQGDLVLLFSLFQFYLSIYNRFSWRNLLFVRSVGPCLWSRHIMSSSFRPANLVNAQCPWLLLPMYPKSEPTCPAKWPPSWCRFMGVNDGKHRAYFFTIWIFLDFLITVELLEILPTAPSHKAWRWRGFGFGTGLDMASIST